MLGFLQERHRMKAICIEVCFVFSVTTCPPVGERIWLVLFWYLIAINISHEKNKNKIKLFIVITILSVLLKPDITMYFHPVGDILLHNNKH